MDIIGSLVSLLFKTIAGFVLVTLAILSGTQSVADQAPQQTQSQTTQTQAANTAENFPTAASSTVVMATSSSKTTVTISHGSAKPVSQTISTDQTATTPTQATAQTMSTEALNTVARSSIVNVLCTTAAGGSFRPISGSGVIIDGRGVVLTNAHVAQYFLLKDYPRPGNIDCAIRTGSPAVNTYRAELLYLPPKWIDDNAKELVAPQATGTGENDFAFLRITGPYSPQDTMPASIPHLALSIASPNVGDTMLLAAYPAGFLSGELIATQLYASSAFAYVTQLFTFDDKNKPVDLFSIGGSIESQAGSSGGAVVRGDGTLAGIIATALLDGATNQRDLRAISLGFINRALASFGQGGIQQLLTGDVAAKAVNFNTNIAPQETVKLEAALTSTH